MRRFLWLVAALAATVFLATFPIEASYTSKAKLVQRYLPHKGTTSAATNGERIGGPQKLIIDDPKAYMSGTTAEGAARVDEKYLVDHKIYPLPLKTVEALALYARLGLPVVFVLTSLGGYAMGRR